MPAIPESTLQLTLATVTSVLVAVALSVLVSIVYRTTHRGMQYSASFALALVMLSAVGTLVMMVIGDSLARAFGVFGALSLVRFRTAVKDPKDIAFVFLALAIGMAAGTGRFIVASAGTMVILIVVAVLHKVHFGSRVRDDFLLRVVYRRDAESALQRALDTVSQRAVMLTMQTFDGDAAIEATWLLTLRGQPGEATRQLAEADGVSDVHITATREELEL